MKNTKSLMIFLAISFAARCQAQTQLMPPQKEQLLRSYIPKLDEGEAFIEKLGQALLFTDEEMPPMHQSQPLAGGVGASRTFFMSIYQQVNGSYLPTNANRDFPWGTPGGLHLVPPETRYEFKTLWLPPKPGGGVWPIIVFTGSLERSTRVNMPSPQQANKWIFPAGAIIGELGLKNFSDGSFATYETRFRLREIDGWSFERHRPDIALQKFVSSTYETLSSTHPRIKAFSRSAVTHVLPPTPNARQKLWAAQFVSVIGTDAIIPTAHDRDNIVPQFYAGHFLTNCNDCHRDTLREASQFEEREWYDYIRGSADGVFSLRPLLKNGQLNPTLAAAGMVEYYDPAKHPPQVYAMIPEYDNGPRNKSLVTRAEVRSYR